jgi:hypothetical protein
MAHLMFFVAAIAASLFWTAACIAAAARTERAWLRRLLVAAGVLLPAVLLLPWVGITAVLARQGYRPNYFAPMLTAFLSAVVGGWWFWRAGLSRADGGGFVAAAWPAFGLAALFLAAEAAAFGTLLGIDRDVVAEGRALRVEAAQLMAASLPPAPAPDDDAAPLYERAFAALAADKPLADWPSPQRKLLQDCGTADVAGADVAALLSRHAVTLDLVRRAAAKPGCRFVRDWSRPAYDMVLPEYTSMRQAAGLLALAARRESAAGDSAAALRDVVLLRRLGTHAAADPLLLAGLVAKAIDGIALDTLAAVLPSIEKKDLPLLVDRGFSDFLGTPVSYKRHLLGEETWGLTMFAALADGQLDSFAEIFGSASPLDVEPLASVYRWFFWRGDVAAYKRSLRLYQDLLADPADRHFPAGWQRLAAIQDQQAAERRRSVLGKQLIHTLEGCFRSQWENEALHRCAEVLVAVTRARLATGSLPESIAAVVPDQLPAMPLDPFAADAPLRAKFSEDGWVVWSIGPDGEDDGGPPAPGVERENTNDDVGLRMGTGR